jgi:hypothetical protein
MRAAAASLIMLALGAAAAPSAQPVPAAAFKDQPIGWMRTVTFPAPPSPVTVDARTYSAAQIGVGRRLIGWMQSTYAPIGGLGDLVVSVSEKLGPYNQNTAALPQSYGALARIYTDLKYDTAGKIVRASNSHIVWSIMVNGFYGEPADALSTPERYYFTLPTLAQQAFGGEDVEKAVDLSAHPVLGRYPSYYQRNSVNGNRKFVMLTRDNRLPYVAVTKGEYLSVLEAAVARLYAVEKKRVDGESNATAHAAFLKALEDKQARRLATLASNREKYKSRLSEPATIATISPDALLENVRDVFEGNGGSGLRVQVYTIDPRNVAGAKTDTPQWVVVSWTAQMTDPASRHLHEAVIKTFNFQYLHDYFFEPEKVKGQAYAPLR